MGSCRILVVEDTEFNRQFLTLSLKKENYELIFVENGAECLNMLKKDGDFSLILMDIETPILTGADACKIIKETYAPQLRKIPIVAVTGHSDEKYLTNLLSNGFSGFLIKPYQKADLLTTIEKYIDTQIQKDSIDDATDPMNYNLSSLEEWASGDQQMIRELITLFVKEAPAKLKELKIACNRNDWTEVQNIAHSFAPQLSFVGLDKSYEETSEIEVLAMKNVETEKIEQLLKQVETTCKNAIFELKKDFQL